MSTKPAPVTMLGEWKTILGDRVEIDEATAWRDLWAITAEDGARYFLKCLGPWRNLPLADEARAGDDARGVEDHPRRQGRDR